MHESRPQSPSTNNMADQLNIYRKLYASKFKRSKVAPPPPPPPLQNGIEPQEGCGPMSGPGQQLGDGPTTETIRGSEATNLEHSNDNHSRTATHNSDESAAAAEEQSNGQDQSVARLPELEASAVAPDDHIETLNFHPDTQSANTSEISESRRGGKESRLAKATRAIFLFRRATTSLNSVASGATTPKRRSAGFRASRTFVSAFWRQNTAPDGAQTRSARRDSLASPNNRSHHSLTAFLSSAGGGLAAPDQSAEGNQQASFGLPRFIVPKVNALKLPIVCLIKSLDDELIREIFIHRYELGQYLMDNLKVSLNMADEKYFGLKMADSLDEQEDVRRAWLDLNESVYKQISKHGRLSSARASEPSGGMAATKSVSFYLRIKFYPPNLARIQDQFLKQYLWLQLGRDLRLGKLTSSMNNLTYLMACVLQHELGDYKPELVNERLATMNILPNQDLIEQQAVDIWRRRLAGAKTHLVMMQFLRASVILETYGFDYYPVRDHQRQRAYLLGFNYAGVKTIRNGRIVNHFRWHNLSKISYERRMIIFHIYSNENSKRKQILGFKCLSNDECQNLYLRLLEQKYFFTVDLAYFDKSIRHPSHLREVHSAAHQSHQSSGEWAAPAGDQAPLEDYLGVGAGPGERPDADEEQVVEEGSPAASSTRRSIPRLRHLGAHRSEEGPPRSSTRTFESSDGCSNFSEPVAQRRSHSGQLEGATAALGELEPRSEWHQSQTGLPPTSASERAGSNKRAAACAKSSSLQGAPCGQDGCPSPSGACDERPGWSSQPSSPGLQFTCCAGDWDDGAAPRMPPRACCATARHEIAPMQGATRPRQQPHYSGHQAHQLQRQCSFAKYSPDHDDNDARFAPQQRISPTTTGGGGGGGDHERHPFARAEQQMASDENPSEAPNSGERLIHWTEQVLVQPAAVFARPDGTLAGQAAHAANANNEILMQVVRLSLLILLLNFVLRLSDGLSNALIEMLSFGDSSPAATTSQPPKHSSMFNGPSEN